MVKVAVIGGGVSGLTAAFEILERAGQIPGGVELRCYEGSRKAGGNIETARVEGFLCEWGPTGFLDNVPATLDLVERLGLTDRIVRANSDAEKRFIFRKGKLRSVPTKPPAFLASDILSFGGKLRMFGEPFAARRPAGDESVFDFAARRIGPEAAAVLVDAMVAGVYAGDARQLSLAATFPKMHKMESDHGSLFRAMLAKMKQARAAGTKAGGPAGPGGRLTSFREGLQELIDALVDKLGDSLVLDAPIRSISYLGDRGYRIHPEEGPPHEVDAVVLSTPAWKAAEIVGELAPEIATPMSEIPSAPLAVVHFGYSLGALGELPDGFGFLVPRNQGPRILGTLWPSCIFPDRAPDGRRLFTVMIGGAHEPRVLDNGDTKIADLARADLQLTMGIIARPYFTRVIRHPRGIPQYTLGHLDRVAAIEAGVARYPGLEVCGNSYRGISVNLCVEEAPTVADGVISHLTRR